MDAPSEIFARLSDGDGFPTKRVPRHTMAENICVKIQYRLRLWVEHPHLLPSMFLHPHASTARGQGLLRFV